MKKRRRWIYRRRTRDANDVGGDGQDSFLDVVSNLVGILIILVMIAGSRVRDAAVAGSTSEAVAASSEDNGTSVENANSSALDAAASSEKGQYVDAANLREDLQAKVEKTRVDADELNARTLLVEQQANGAEEEYKRLLEATAALDGALETAARERSDADKIAFDLKSELFEKEKTRDDLRKEKESLEAARPNATVLENLPTPISKQVEAGREGYFRLKNGRIVRVPLNEFQERVRLYFKNFRGDLSQKEHEEKIGPIDGFTFHYFVDVVSSRDSDGISYTFVFRYGECLPENDDVGEPIDDALSNADSVFLQKLSSYSRDDTTITLFVYPDSFQYLRDVKKFIISRGYQIAMRPFRTAPRSPFRRKEPRPRVIETFKE